MPPIHGTASRQTRPSVVYCSEKFACATQPAVASFFCEQCGTSQCIACELQLHSSIQKNGRSRFEFHDRHRLAGPPPDEVLCERPATVGKGRQGQSVRGGGCEPRNMADVICAGCGHRRYCFDCDTHVHHRRPMCGHRRVLLSKIAPEPPLSSPPLLLTPDDLVAESPCLPRPPLYVDSDDRGVLTVSDSGDAEMFMSLSCITEDVSLSERVASCNKVHNRGMPDLNRGDCHHQQTVFSDSCVQSEESCHGSDSFHSLDNVVSDHPGTDSAPLTCSSVVDDDNDHLVCMARCLSCNAACLQSATGHHDDSGGTADHTASPQSMCIYSEKFNNRILLCEACHKVGKKVHVKQKPSSQSSDVSSWYSLAVCSWIGYVLECSNCGVVYRSNEHWFSNVEPNSSTAVRNEVCHVWSELPDDRKETTTDATAPMNRMRSVMDKMTVVTDIVSGIGASEPARMIGGWLTDCIAPSNWVPNAQLANCYSCLVAFDAEITKHHCRSCGQGFCDHCSAKRKVLDGWGTSPVRVCDDCFNKSSETEIADSVTMLVVPSTSSNVIPRLVGETIGSTVGALAAVVRSSLINATRPAHWVPDHDILACAVCDQPFGAVLRRHHCRACGQGVCDRCSPRRQAVPARGWSDPVRICTKCEIATDNDS